MLLDLLGKKSTSLHIGIFMNDLGITVEDHDPCGSIMHKSKTKLEQELRRIVLCHQLWLKTEADEI